MTPGGRGGTEHDALRARVERAERMATIGSVTAGVAHDLGAPVGAALAALEEACQLARAHAATLGGDGGALVQALDDARRACEQIRHVSRDVRALSRLDDGPPTEASADVCAALDAAARMAAHALRGRARLVRAYGPIPPVRASEPRLTRVFLNLVVNAAQAVAPGAPERNEVRLRAATAPEGRVVVEIEDTGCGMTAEVRRRLFTPFFTSKPGGAGTGLGLSICRRIVREVGGEIDVASAPGRGTRVRVLLPAAPPADAPPRTDGGGEHRESPRAGRPRVLVVDDEESVHRAMGRLLGKGLDVVCADAESALARLERGDRYDLVLCDVSMPEMSGLELRRRVEAIDPAQAVRLAFLTGGTFGPDARDPQAFAGVALLDKAAHPEELRAGVEARLRAVGRGRPPA